MKNNIREFLENNKNQIIKDLSDLVRIPSVASESDGSSVFGKGPCDILQYCAELFGSEGLETRIHPQFAYAIAEAKGDEKTIGIFGHGDVVSAVEEDWTVTKPFAPIEKDGFLFGRGSEDNKSGVVSALWAYKALKHSGIMPKSTLMFYVGGNEEGGMCDLKYFTDNEKMPDFSIVPDNEYPVCRGEKGILRFWADIDAGFENIILISGGHSLNIVLGSVDCEIKYSIPLLDELHAYCDSRSEYTLTVGDTVKLTAKGKSTHAAYSDGSVNALAVLIDALLHCPSLGSDLDTLRGILPLVSDPFSEALGLGTSDSEFMKTTCTTGIVRTDNSKLSLSFDMRYGTAVNVDFVLDGYKKYLTSVNADMRVTERDEGYVIPADSPIIVAMNEAYTAVTGEKKEPNVSYGGTYARHLKNAVSIGTYIPTKKKPELPEGHGGIHQPDEMIDIDGLIKSIEVIVHMILKADETLYN